MSVMRTQMRASPTTQLSPNLLRAPAGAQHVALQPPQHQQHGQSAQQVSISPVEFDGAKYRDCVTVDSARNLVTMLLHSAHWCAEQRCFEARVMSLSGAQATWSHPQTRYPAAATASGLPPGAHGSHYGSLQEPQAYARHLQQQVQQQRSVDPREALDQLHRLAMERQRQYGEHVPGDSKHSAALLAAVLTLPTSTGPLRAPAQPAYKPVRVVGDSDVYAAILGRCVKPTLIPVLPKFLEISLSAVSYFLLFRPNAQRLTANPSCARHRLRAPSLPVPVTPHQAPADRRQAPRSRRAGVPAAALGQRQCGMAAILTGPVRLARWSGFCPHAKVFRQRYTASRLRLDRLACITCSARNFSCTHCASCVRGPLDCRWLALCMPRLSGRFQL